MGTARAKGRVALASTVLASALLLCSPAARADVGETIIQRCTHGQSLSGFSQSAYNQALKELSADAEQYTDCGALIRRAELAAAGGGGASEGALVPLAATPAEPRALAAASKAGAGPVSVGGTLVHPGVVRANVSSAFSTLPTPLLATVAFLLAWLLVVAGGTLRNRVRARRSD
jgi:hypothetical protein